MTSLQQNLSRRARGVWQGNLRLVELLFGVTVICGCSIATCQAASPHTICEGQTATLSCGHNKYVHVKSALYGRGTDSSVCVSAATRPCGSPTVSLAKVKEVCDGKRQCSIPVNNDFFTDPCPGVGKYLSVTYECQVYTPLVQTICENGLVTISCGTEYVQVTSAQYGHSHDNYACSVRSAKSCGSSVDALAKIHNHCNKKKTCTFKADNRFFGDPCPGDGKYLVIHNKCGKYIPSLGQTICQGRQVTIDCGTDYVHVTSAHYGHSPGNNACSVSSTKACGSSVDTLVKIQDHCYMKRTCTFKADNRFFSGNPCPGENEYLIVNSQCHSSVPSGTKRLCAGEDLDERCPHGTSMTVLTALYGRGEDKTLCPGPSPELLKPCGDGVTSLAKLEAQCTKSKCAFWIMNLFYGSDPCPGMGKYLFFTYRCT